MIYERRLTIPKNTLQESPATVELELHPGVIQLVSVFFPSGCAGLAHIQVMLWERILWPANPNSDFTGDDTLIQFPEDLELMDPPYTVTLIGWNLDDTFPHTPILRVQLSPFDKSLRRVLDRLVVGPSGPIRQGGL